MTETRLWDRAAIVPDPVDRSAAPGDRRPPRDLPTVGELFDFMRDAEMRFETLRLRIEERDPDLARRGRRRHGQRRCAIRARPRSRRRARRTRRRPEYEVWISDGEIVRTYASAHGLGTQRPVRNRPRGLDDPDLPGTAKVYEPVTALPMETLPDTFVHPAGYCQNVLATGRCLVSGTDIVARPRGDPARVRPPAHDRAPRRPARLPHLDRGRPRTGVILRLVESIGGEVTRHAEVIELLPDVPLPAAAFYFVFPTGTTMLY